MTAGTDAAPGRAHAPPRESWLALAALLSGTFLGTLATAVASIALPTIEADFGASTEQTQLVVSGYTLAFAATLVVGGKLGDRFGRRRVFRLGAAAFLVMSVACALAPTLPVLVGLRVLQGLSASLMVPQVLALIRASFRERKERAVSFYSATLGLAAVGGMAVGGLLAGAAGWRAVFVVNVPVCLFILATSGSRFLPETRGRVLGLDLLGPVLLVAAMLTVLAPASWPGLFGSAPVTPVAVVVGFAVLLVMFVGYERVVERRRPDTALVPPAMFARASVWLGLVILAVYYTGTGGFNLLLAYHLQAGYGLSQFVAGALAAAIGIGFVAGSALAPRATRWWGARVVIVGCTVMVATRAATALVQGMPPVPAAVSTSLLAGLAAVGQGLVVAPLMERVMSAVAARYSGVASGVLLTITNCAMAVGQAVFLALYSGLPAGPPTSFGTAMWVMSGLAVVTVAVSAIAQKPFDRDRGVSDEDQ